MMAADLDVTTSVIPALVTTRRLEGTLVVPMKTQQVPNHLTDTRIFGNTETNEMLQINPSVVHFKGYKTGEICHRTLHIINSSKHNQQMHIIPPTTSFFTIKYSKKKSSLIPGLSLDVTVEFKPKDWRYYYDCVRIHCKGEKNVLVPIHAYPVMNTANFPRNVTFDPTPIGQTLTKTISLKCGVPVDFEYQLVYIKSHPAFSINAMKGVVPANGEVSIKIEFSPTEFSTAIMTVKLELSQYNFTPVVCTFTGTSAPGLAIRPPDLPLPVKPKHIHVRRQAGKVNKLRSLGNITKIDKPPSTALSLQEIIHNGIIFPMDLDTPSAVGKVLTQKPGKIKASLLKRVSHKSISTNMRDGFGSRKIKEALFLQDVRQAAKEEQRNQLRWVTCLGELPMTTEEENEVYQEREGEKEVYQRLCHVVVPEEEYVRTQNLIQHRKTRRKAGQVPDCPQPTFDPFLNNEWFRRHLALQKFVQAGRKVIVRLRCQARLKKLQRLIHDLKSGKNMNSLGDSCKKDLSVLDVVSLLPSSTDYILPSSFPKYKDDASICAGEVGGDGGTKLKPVDEINTVSVTNIKKDVPYVDLKVPQQSIILGYSPVLLSEVTSYVPPGLHRNLLSGAKDELECLVHIPGVDPSFLTPNAFASILSDTLPTHQDNMLKTPQTDRSSSLPSVSSADFGLNNSAGTGTDTTFRLSHSSKSSKKRTTVLLRGKDNEARYSAASTAQMMGDGVGGGSEVFDDNQEEVEAGRVMAPVIMPCSLCESPCLNSHQILNPTPGVTSYVPLLPNSEATLDHNLLPLPINPSSKHPRVKLDPIDGISQLMHWKKFPSPCLLTLNSDKKLATLWKPYLSDPFSSDLLPSCDQLPALLTGVQPDDYVDTESTEILPVPTMDMIKAQFYIPVCQTEAVADSSPKSRSKENQAAIIKQQPSALFHEAMGELEKSRLNEFNQLGQRIKNKLQIFCGRVDNSLEEDTATAG